MTHLSFIEVSRTALIHNLRALESLRPPGTRTAAVLKANAYGHGVVEIATTLYGEVHAFQVDDIEEAAELDGLHDPEILIYGYVPLSEIENGAFGEYAQIAVYSAEQIEALARAKRAGKSVPRFSLKIDALLGRQGILPSDVDAFLDLMTAYPELAPTSAYAHYANIEDTTDLTHAVAQDEAFEGAFAKLQARWPAIERHISATSGHLTRPNAQNAVVRLGIGLYGLYPSASLARSHAHLNLKPVMRWVTHLAQVKTLPDGHPVGYGLTYRTARPTRVGIVPQGYSDGYDRGLSNVGEVLVHGRRCPVIGRVAMNMFAVDLTPAPDARAEDEVVLLGAQGEDRIAAEEIAAKLGTINYEVVARVSPRLPRVVV